MQVMAILTLRKLFELIKIIKQDFTRNIEVQTSMAVVKLHLYQQTF